MPTDGREGGADATPYRACGGHFSGEGVAEGFYVRPGNWRGRVLTGAKPRLTLHGHTARSRWLATSATALATRSFSKLFITMTG